MSLATLLSKSTHWQICFFQIYSFLQANNESFFVAFYENRTPQHSPSSPLTVFKVITKDSRQ